MMMMMMIIIIITIELACCITASYGMKCQKRLPLLLGERDSVNWYVTPLSSCTRVHPYLLTKLLSVCQKEDKNVRITTQNVDLLVPSCCCVLGMQYYSRICLFMIWCELSYILSWCVRWPHLQCILEASIDHQLSPRRRAVTLRDFSREEMS